MEAILPTDLSKPKSTNQPDKTDLHKWSPYNVSSECGSRLFCNPQVQCFPYLDLNLETILASRRCMMKPKHETIRYS
jgi:hypothetical protein